MNEQENNNLPQNGPEMGAPEQPVENADFTTPPAGSPQGNLPPQEPDVKILGEQDPQTPPQSPDCLLNPGASATNSADDSAPQQHANALDDFAYVLGNDSFNLQPEPAKEGNIYRKSAKKSPKKGKKRTKSLGSVVWVLVICAVSVALAAFIVIFSSEYLGIGFGKGGECVVDIKSGMSTAQIASELKESGAINNALMFRIYSKLAGKDGTYKYGVYTFTNELGYKEIAAMLQTDGAKADTVRVTIPEGATIDDIIKLLEKNNICTKQDFRNAVLSEKFNDFDFVAQIPKDKVYYQFEGYLFPDTYDFYCYEDKAECAQLAIRRMLQNTADKLTPAVRKKAEEMNRSLHEILTMASIVELEASSTPEEMANVAAVFYNRLSWDEPHLLGSSPTANYPYGDGRYDTNKTEGLPPGPLCAPSAKAIEAAANPTPNFTATYFVTDSDMKFYYNNTLAAHNQTIASLKAKGKWLG